jgi:dCMP deaminase
MPSKEEFDQLFMDIAKKVSQLSKAKRLKVGAVLAKDDRIISIGYNGTPVGMNNCCEDEDGDTKENVVHAEANVIAFLARTSESTVGATMYTTTAPCPRCAALIIQCQVKRLVFNRRYRYDAGLDILAEGGVEVVTLDPQKR